MQLLPEDKLIWSPVVANSRMNRERNSSGINSYEQELKFRPESYLESKIKESGNVSWLDLCCGEGKALLQTAEYFYTKGLQDRIMLKGIDLVDTFLKPNKEINSVEFKLMSLIDWKPEQSYDLITCIHGLHYLGDKLKVIQTAIKALNPSGLFIANLDLNNIIVDEVRSATRLKNLFKEKGMNYNSRLKLLKQNGHATISFDLTYLGADDGCGPNYTGQDSVASYYAV